MKRYDTACYFSPYNMKMQDSQLQTTDPHWIPTFLAPLFQYSTAKHVRQTFISVKPPFCNITLLADWITCTQIYDMATSSQHVANYVFPSAPISQLTEGKKKTENDFIFIFFKDWFLIMYLCVHICTWLQVLTKARRRPSDLRQPWATTMDVSKQILVLWKRIKHWSASLQPLFLG